MQKLRFLDVFMKNERFWCFSRKVELILAPYESIRWKGLKGSKESIFLKFRIKKIWSFGFHENLRFLGFFEKIWKFEFFSLVRVDICYIWIYKVKDIKINYLSMRARSSTSYSRRKPGWRFTAGAQYWKRSWASCMLRFGHVFGWFWP